MWKNKFCDSLFADENRITTAIENEIAGISQIATTFGIVSPYNDMKAAWTTYKTVYDPNKNKYTCSCMGFWRSKGNCKHVIALKEKHLATKVK